MPGVHTRDTLSTAQQLYANGQYSESEQSFRLLLETDLRGEALYGLALIAARRGDEPRARALLEQSVGVNRSNPAALYELARRAATDGQRDAAVGLLAETLLHDARHRGALEELVNLAQAEAANGPKAPPVVTPTRPPGEPTSPSSLVGVVSGLSKTVGPHRGSPAAAQIWEFRVQKFDTDGTPGAVEGVMMRGREINGTLQNGDWVEIIEPPEDGVGYRPHELRNLTLNAIVTAKKLPWW